MEFEEGVRYIVTKDSDDKSFLVGDHIRMEAGCLTCAEAQGWMEKEHLVVATKGMECMPDLDWYAKREAELEQELKSIRERKA